MIVPAYTFAPGSLRSGSGSPVSMLSSTKDTPSVTTLLSSGETPEDIISDILKDFSPKFSDEKQEISFYCNCSKERVQKVLISLGKDELKDMISEGKPTEVHCHFCNTDYVFSVKELSDFL